MNTKLMTDITDENLAADILARTLKAGATDAEVHASDHRALKIDVRNGAMRCLALSNRGGVYEGDMTMLESGTLQLDLKGYEGDQVVPLIVQLDIEKDGTLRGRVWSVKGGERTLMFDIHHQKLDAKKD